MKYLFYGYAWLLGNLSKRFPKASIFNRTGSTSIIKINKSQNQVTKKVILYNRYNVVENEAKWLIKLSGYQNTPELISVNNNILTLSYAGEIVCHENLPIDWESQMMNILNKLDEIDCSHNDIKPSDILVKEGQLMLIDFQWATKKGIKIPTNWPSFIGRTFKKRDGTYDDHYSFRKSVGSLIE